MPRGRPPMPWIKWHYAFLDSSINYEMDLAQQAVYIKLCLYSSNCGSKAGVIVDNDGKPIPDWFVANCIHAPAEIVRETIEIGLKTNRFTRDGAGAVEIVNWQYYQSEYARQKPFREAKTKKAQLELKQERKRLGLCENCGEEGHDKFECPHSKLQHMVKR